MTTFSFKALALVQVLQFDPTQDRMRFDLKSLAAGDGYVELETEGLRFRYGGKTWLMAGVLPEALSYRQMIFADGSRIWLGDGTVGTDDDDLSNTLLGTGKDDWLDGLGGADRMRGLRGDDTYVVDSPDDRIQERAGQGRDRVFAVVSYTLPAHVEALTLMGPLALDGTGNSSANLLVGSDADNRLDGADGNDTVNGGGGSDTLIGGPGDDRIDGGNGEDTAIYHGNRAGYRITFNSDGGITVRDREGADGDDGADLLHGIESLQFADSTAQVGGFTVSVTDFDIVEGDADPRQALLTVTLNMPNALREVRVDYATRDGSATAGSDYGAGAGTLVFARGETSQTIAIPIFGDRQIEADEFFQVRLLRPVNAALASGSATVSILNNDQPTLSVANVTVNENLGRVTVEAILSEASNEIVSAQFATLDGTALSGEDYAATTGGLTFAPGVTRQTFEIQIFDDTRLELPEAFKVHISSPSGAEVGAEGGTVSVLSDDQPSVSVSDVSIPEDSADRLAELTLTLSEASPFSMSVDYVSREGTARSGEDFTPVAGTVIFGPGEVSKSVSVATAGDNVAEVDEAFYLDWTVAGQSNRTGGTGRISILNDDGFAQIDLRDDGGWNGFKIAGGVPWSADATVAVSDVGDVNGDGYDDAIVGLPSSSGVALNDRAGSAHLVYGRAKPFPQIVDLQSVSADEGFIIDGDAGDRLGKAVSGLGDVNGDGKADFAVTTDGFTYVIYGAERLPNVREIDGTNGFRVADIDSVSAAGDLNGDGLADTAFAVAGNAQHPARYFLVFGQRDATPATRDLNLLDGSDGFRLDGERPLDNPRGEMSGAGDVNGDGYGDLLIGATGDDAAYVMFGRGSRFERLYKLVDLLDGRQGFRVAGSGHPEFNGGLGYDVSSAGDFNGDGFSDLIVSLASGESSSPSNTFVGGVKTSYVVLGHGDAFVPAVSVDSLDGANGFRLDGTAFHFAEQPVLVSGAGDVNGDGYDDLLVASGGARTSGIVFGRAGGFQTAESLPILDRTRGVTVFERPGILEYEPGALSRAGDLNGDGFSDFIVGIPTAGCCLGGFTSDAFVVFGSNLSQSVTHLGGSEPERLTGTSAPDRMVAGADNDILVGGGGEDALYAGAGDDTIQLADLKFLRVDGGNGEDTLMLPGVDEPVDLAKLQGRLRGIERIDLTDGSQQFLSIRRLALLNLSETSNALQINGDVGDVVNLADSDWAATGLIALGGIEFRLFESANARLLVQKTLAVSGLNGPMDLQSGGSGDDVFVVDNLSDEIVEASDAGIDHVYSSVGYSLPDNVEHLTLVGSGDFDGVGNRSDNRLSGNIGNKSVGRACRR